MNTGVESAVALYFFLLLVLVLASIGAAAWVMYMVRERIRRIQEYCSANGGKYCPDWAVRAGRRG